MRIISGKYRRRRLVHPANDATRPVKDRVKESLFNSLHPFHYARVLDLFAGSGALGLEALSRGATHAVFVEKDRDAFNALCANTEALVTEPVNLHHTDAFGYLKKTDERFDLILIDPPYGRRLAHKALMHVITHNVLAPGGRIIVLCGQDETIGVPDALALIKSRDVGITRVSHYEWSDES